MSANRPGQNRHHPQILECRPADSDQAVGQVVEVVPQKEKNILVQVQDWNNLVPVQDWNFLVPVQKDSNILVPVQ